MTEYKSIKEVREWKRKAVANRTVKEYGKYLKERQEKRKHISASDSK